MAVVCGIIWARQELTKNMASVINDRGHILKDLVGIDGVDVISVIESVLVRVWSTKVP